MKLEHNWIYCYRGNKLAWKISRGLHRKNWPHSKYKVKAEMSQCAQLIYTSFLYNTSHWLKIRSILVRFVGVGVGVGDRRKLIFENAFSFNFKFPLNLAISPQGDWRQNSPPSFQHQYAASIISKWEWDDDDHQQQSGACSKEDH